MSYQKTHHCNGPGLPEYPQDTEPQAVNVWVHNSGMLATHDYACPVCRSAPAVLTLSCGVFQPCWGCQEAGWSITRREPSLMERIRKLFGRSQVHAATHRREGE